MKRIRELFSETDFTIKKTKGIFFKEKNHHREIKFALRIFSTNPADPFFSQGKFSISFSLIVSQNKNMDSVLIAIHFPLKKKSNSFRSQSLAISKKVSKFLEMTKMINIRFFQY